LIQLSTPIQTAVPIQNGVIETESAHVEGLSADSPEHLGQIAEKKNGPGFFAKLLESLAAKHKARESEDAENAGSKLLPETEATNTAGRLLPEHMDLSNEQANALAIGQLIGLPIDQSAEQLADLPIQHPIAPLIKSDILVEAEKPVKPKGRELFKGENQLLQALFSQDTSSEVQTRRAEKGISLAEGRKSVHAGENTFPREMVMDERQVESGELADLLAPAEAAEELLVKADAGDDLANSAAKLAAERAQTRGFSSPFPENSGLELSRAKNSQVSPEEKPAGENGENRRGTHAAESRGRRGRERAAVEFVDLRTETQANADAGNARGVSFNAQGQTPLRPELEISVDLNPKTPSSEAGKAGGETFQSRAFEDALARELRGDLSRDIVRDATIIARNGGEGTIRLTLHPASLGNVKVRLEMAENKITALIVVESDEALRAFQKELPVLEKAFKDSGFSQTDLSMSLAQDEKNFANQEGKEERDFPAIAPVMAASRYDSDTGPAQTWMPVNGETDSAARPERIPVNLLV